MRKGRKEGREGERKGGEREGEREGEGEEQRDSACDYVRLVCVYVCVKEKYNYVEQGKLCAY